MFIAALIAALLLPACEDPAAIRSAEAAKLLETDRAFAAKSVKDGAAAAFFSVMDRDALQLPANGPPVMGREDVRARLTKLPPQVLDWTPVRAEVAASLDLGWTWGEWRLLADATSRKLVARGKYLNIWKRAGDGGWQLAVDIGNEAQDAAESRPATPPATPGDSG